MTSGEETATFQSQEDGRLLISAMSKFALDLYKEQGKRKDGNMFISPFSISAVLNMAYLGAKEHTLQEMKAALSFSALDDSKLHQAFGDLLSYLKVCNDKVTARYDHQSRSMKDEPIFKLFMANRLYAEQSYKVLQEYQADCRKYYAAELHPVDFVNKASDSAQQINSWVLEVTNQKIKDLLPPNSVNESTRLILVNAIYFKSAWDDTFKKESTHDADFFVSSEKTTKVQMMYRNMKHASYCFLDDLKCHVLKLPYKVHALSMIIFLPDKSTSLEAVEKTLTVNRLTNIDASLEGSKEVNLWLPKFKMEATLQLKEVLCQMGVKSLFKQTDADLSGIDGTKNLYASEVIHKAFVDVNEDGTEAAAATALMMMGCCLAMGPPPVDFRADHPFLFFIREEKTKAVLFLGRVIEPKY